MRYFAFTGNNDEAHLLLLKKLCPIALTSLTGSEFEQVISMGQSLLSREEIFNAF
jgi:hypothetical protein